MVSTPSGMLILLSVVHPEKALIPMVRTELGIMVFFHQHEIFFCFPVTHCIAERYSRFCEINSRYFSLFLAPRLACCIFAFVNDERGAVNGLTVND